MDNKDSFLQPQVSQYGNHMVMTNVSKPTKTKYCNLDTRFRDDYDGYFQNTGTYTITMPQQITDVKSITAVNAEIPISFYNISADLGNNVLKIDSSYVIVPDGNYNTTTFISTLKTRFTATGVNQLSVDISNNRVIMKNTSGSPIGVDFAVKNAKCSNINTVDFAVKKTSCLNVRTMADKMDFKSTLGWLMGFRDISYNILGSGGSNMSESLVDINHPRYLYLAIDEFTSGTQNSFVSPLTASIVNKNILAKITMDYATFEFGTVIPANEYNGRIRSDIRSYNGKVNLQRFKVQLLNEWGNPIDLNGLDFSFCLKIEYE